MDPSKIKAVIEALKSEDAAAALSLLEEMLVAAAGGEPEAEVEEEPAALESDAGAIEDPPPAVAEKEKLATAALSRLVTLSGKGTIGEAVAEFEAFKKLEAERARDQARLEADERRGLVKGLIDLGVEVPATAYSDVEKGVLCSRLTSEPITDLRARVKALATAKGRKVTLARAPELSHDDQPVTRKALSRAERDYCTREGINEEEFHRRAAAKTRRS